MGKELYQADKRFSHLMFTLMTMYEDNKHKFEASRQLISWTTYFKS